MRLLPNAGLARRVDTRSARGDGMEKMGKRERVKIVAKSRERSQTTEARRRAIEAWRQAGSDIARAIPGGRDEVIPWEEGNKMDFSGDEESRRVA